MSYKIGQLRKNQISKYETSIENFTYTRGSSSNFQGQPTQIGSSIVYDTVVGIPGSYLIKDTNYYLIFQFKSLSQYGHFKVKLIGDNISMTVKEFKVNPYDTCEVVFTPNDDKYTAIVFELVRTDSYQDGIVLDNIQLKSLTNVITHLQSRYDNLAYLKKMGLQGPPGLLFSMNGEEFYMGKSGIYEIQDINITNLSFVIKDDVAEVDGKQKNYFIMDFQY